MAVTTLSRRGRPPVRFGGEGEGTWDLVDANVMFDVVRGRLVSYAAKRLLTGTVTVAALGATFDMEVVQDQAVTVRVIGKSPLPK